MATLSKWPERQAIVKHLSANSTAPYATAVANESDEHIEIAYKAMQSGASNKKIIYLLGGNSPSQCPFN
jgi:hypothetical protein